MSAGTTEDFDGAKIAVLTGDQVLVLLRDDRPDIPFPGHWDLPGGGREGDETPRSCALRELREEFGLVLPASALVWENRFETTPPRGTITWFFVARDTIDPAAIRFGDEGRSWRLMPIEDYLGHPLAIPHMVERLSIFLGRTRI